MTPSIALIPSWPVEAFSEESVTVAVKATLLPPVPWGFTVSEAMEVLLPYEAEIVAEVTDATEAVFTVNVAEADPAGIVTLGGTVATEVLSLERVITNPPLGATTLSVT